MLRSTVSVANRSFCCTVVANTFNAVEVTTGMVTLTESNTLVVAPHRSRTLTRISSGLPAGNTPENTLMAE